MSTPTTAEFVAGTSIALLAIVAIAIGTIVPALAAQTAEVASRASLRQERSRAKRRA